MLLAVLFAGSYVGYQLITGNFHTVVPGELYRSGQLGPARLAQYVHRYAIRTVINLRGHNPGKKWYHDEVAEAASLGVVHLDFKMSAHSDFTVNQARQIIRIMKDAPKPILIHCEGGADRSGLVAAIYLVANHDGGENAAESELSPLYGHFAVPGLSKAYAMDKSWESLEPFLGIKNS
ncbi:MAG: hypothetical protein BGN87_03240 [Rhizobiales bacterium 65-79]|nr:dual specificity protein phosphatase family protein [Hyphomicrobiales bacterium]OJU04927.1 MAG: hypothetical protein BGN87_03240 [Rhizobiales bacterium 65-79]